jgi:hypothetical protein
MASPNFHDRVLFLGEVDFQFKKQFKMEKAKLGLLGLFYHSLDGKS